MSKREFDSRLGFNRFDDDCNDHDSLRGAQRCLKDEVGSVVTIFTQSGGASGCGFTGLLVRVDHDFVKLVTSFPAAPEHPFHRCCCGCGNNVNWNKRFCNGSHVLGSVCCIPTDKIVSYVVNAV
jgi:hypothetical protein